MAEGRTRFSAWLSVAEREGVERVARELGTSENYVVRLAIRQFLDLPQYTQATEPSKAQQL